MNKRPDFRQVIKAATKSVLPIEGWYKILWSAVGGRPWTYILRDIWHEAEYVPSVFLFALGVVAARYLSDIAIIALWVAYTFGYIGGHLFWGSTYKAGQTGDPTEDTSKRK